MYIIDINQKISKISSENINLKYTKEKYISLMVEIKKMLEQKCDHDIILQKIQQKEEEINNLPILLSSEYNY
jgi:hypothetical protein